MPAWKVGGSKLLAASRQRMNKQPKWPSYPAIIAMLAVVRARKEQEKKKKRGKKRPSMLSWSAEKEREN